MKNKPLIITLVILIIVAGLYLYKRQSGQMQTPLKPEPVATSWQTATFEGTLPCADCAGIKTVLTLTLNKEGTGGAYQESSTYLGKAPSTSFDEKGTWKLEIRKEGSLDRSVYILSSQPGQTEAYEAKGVDQLVLLDQQMQPITGSGLNFTLTKTSSK